MNFNTGLPAMSYYDAFNADLKFAERSSKGKWTATTVAAKNSQGLYTDLAFTFDTNQPAIVYYNKTQDARRPRLPPARTALELRDPDHRRRPQHQRLRRHRRRPRPSTSSTPTPPPAA